MALGLAVLATACAHQETTAVPTVTTVSTPAPSQANITSPVPAASIPAAPPAASSAAIYVPDLSHVGESLPDGVFAWDSVMKSVNAAADQTRADFVFNFTNLTAGKIAVVNVHASCFCTTPHLPKLPWIIPPGGSASLPVSVDLVGKTGTLFKSVTFMTEKGRKELMLQINIQPPVIAPMTEAERARGVQMAKADRQAIFKGDCAQCHISHGSGRYGKDLYDAVCAVCHEAEHRATMVPDLHHLKVSTTEDFWRTWISYGKPGTLMPAFAASQGGPLDDLQIASLISYLSMAIPSHPTPAGFN